MGRYALPASHGSGAYSKDSVVPADAIELCLEGLDKFTTEKDVAQFVRKSFVDKVRPQSRCPQTGE